MLLVLLLSVSLHSATSLHCLSCAPHHGQHHTYTQDTCTRDECDTNQFCQLKVHGHDFRVEGHCHDLHHHGKDFQHCLHEMKHWCADFSLAVYHGECNYCCQDQACVNRALNIAPTTSAPVTTTQQLTVPVTTKSQPATSATTTSPNSQTTIRTASCSNQCEDIATDCATTPNVCTQKYGDLVCKKHCGLCDSSKNALPRNGMTTPLPLCVPHSKEDICHTIPGVCSDPLALLACPLFCGLCQPANTGPATVLKTTSAATSPTTSATTNITLALQTNSVCQDHSPACSTPGICTFQYGPHVCPMTCNNCTAATSPVQNPTTAPTSTQAVTSPVQNPTTAPTSTQGNTSPTTTSQPPHNISLTTTSQPAHQHMCYQCGDYNTNDPCTMAELALGTPTPCQTGAYCMTDVYNTLIGDTDIIKRCVQKQECTRKWYDETSDRKSCTSFDSVYLVPRLSCHFCCTGDGCNIDIVPAKSSLFRP